MKQKISLVMFDMSGTTIKDYNEVLECFLEASTLTGINTNSEIINSMMGWSKIDVFRSLWVNQMPDADQEEIEIQAQKSFQLFKQILEHWYAKHTIEPAEGALETFRWLRQNDVKIALCTGFYRKVADILLEKLGWMDGLDANYVNTGSSVIDFSISSDQVEHGRPAPDMIFAAMKVFGITDPREVIKIGDTPSDLQEGRNAGCFKSLGVTNGTHTENQLSQHLNDGLLSGLQVLPTFIKHNSFVEMSNIE
ncbi:MAG: HAD family hydrolase [Saprospiraceae bacterium]